MAWHADASTLYERCSSMAVVGLMPGGGETVALTFGRAAGAEKRSEGCQLAAPRALLPSAIRWHPCLPSPAPGRHRQRAFLSVDPSLRSCPPGLKAEFYAPRDLSIACYLLLSMLAYSYDSVPLALLVLALNCANLSVCMRLKGQEHRGEGGGQRGWQGGPQRLHALPDQACIPDRPAELAAHAVLPPDSMPNRPVCPPARCLTWLQS